MTKAACYLRVSSDEQTRENQLPPLERIAEARGFEVVEVFEETVSATRSKSRPQYDRMLKDARRGRFRVLLFWSLDRFGRGTFENIRAVRELDSLGVRVISHEESWLDTSRDDPIRELLLMIFAWLAAQETRRLSQRTRAGLERARRNGKRLGRPRRILRPQALLARREAGESLRDIAAAFECSPNTVRRALADLERADKGSRGGPPGRDAGGHD